MKMWWWVCDDSTLRESEWMMSGFCVTDEKLAELPENDLLIEFVPWTVMQKTMSRRGQALATGPLVPRPHPSDLNARCPVPRTYHSIPPRLRL